MAKGRYVGRGSLLGYGPQVQVTAVTSTATKLPNWGIASFGSTAAKTWNITMPPVPGQSVTLYCNAAAGGAVQTVDSTGASVFQGSQGAVTNLKFTQPYQSVELIGLTTALYQVKSNNVETPVTTVTSTAVTCPSWGVVLFGATAAKTFLAGAPQKGREVTFIQNYGSTAVRKLKLGASTSIQFVSTGGSTGNVANVAGQHAYLRCVGLSTRIYRILGQSAGWTFTTA